MSYDLDTRFDRKKLFSKFGRVVVKLGTRILTTPKRRFDRKNVNRIVCEIAALKDCGIEIVIVSSGAIAAGMGRMDFSQRPGSIPQLQALAAIGQNILVHNYKLLFKKHGIAVGQVLLTVDDFNDRRRYVHVQNAMESLLGMGAIPIVNENDSVGIEEVKVGDNDNLSSYVTLMINADLLVLFSDVEGLFTDNPRNQLKKPELIYTVRKITPELEGFSTGKAGVDGIGGMTTKLEAAERVTRAGESVVIAHGKKHRLMDIIEGKPVGTFFMPFSERMVSRKRWISLTAKTNGTIVVDDGAKRAIIRGGKSLLPSGIADVKGKFREGDVVKILNSNREEIGRGLTAYSSDEILKIMGKKSTEISGILGYHTGDEIIHRNNMVVAQKKTEKK